jgi:hypothetical protein
LVVVVGDEGKECARKPPDLYVLGASMVPRVLMRQSATACPIERKRSDEDRSEDKIRLPGALQRALPNIIAVRFGTYSHQASGLRLHGDSLIDSDVLRRDS